MNKTRKFIICVLVFFLVLVMGAGDGLDFFDSTTKSTKIVGFDHHGIHIGNAFTVQFQGEVTNIGEQSVVAFTTPDTTRWIHLVAVGEASAVASFVIAEVTSIDPNEGVDTVIYNRNRNSATTSLLLSVHADPNIGYVSTYDETAAASANITTTTTIYREDIGASGNPISASGGGSRGISEFVLKQNTEYAVIITALDANTNIHNIILNFYEHTNQ